MNPSPNDVALARKLIEHIKGESPETDGNWYHLCRLGNMEFQLPSTPPLKDGCEFTELPSERRFKWNEQRQLWVEIKTP